MHWPRAYSTHSTGVLKPPKRLEEIYRIIFFSSLLLVRCDRYMRRTCIYMHLYNARTFTNAQPSSQASKGLEARLILFLFDPNNHVFTHPVRGVKEGGLTRSTGLSDISSSRITCTCTWETYAQNWTLDRQIVLLTHLEVHWLVWNSFNGYNVTIS